MTPPQSYLDVAGFHKAWTSFPPNRCEKTFWTSLETFCAPFLDESYPLRSHEFFSVPHTGRPNIDDLHLIDEAVVASTNEQRMLYDAFSLWNPLAIASLLSAPVGVVIEQLLLAVEYRLLGMRFVLCCRSCGCDIAHHKAVSEINFAATYHTSNAVHCPMCTDSTQIDTLADVKVFFQLERLHPIFHRQHHRLYYTSIAEKRRLETFFCPSGAGFAFTASMPRSRYLLSAPFIPALVELDVEVDAELIGPRDPFVMRVIDLKLYHRVMSVKDRTDSASMILSRTLPSAVRKGAASSPRGLSESTESWTETAVRNRHSESPIKHLHGDSGGDVKAAERLEMSVTETAVLTLRHGKVQFRVYNDTPHSGFLDLFILFDVRTEFSAVTYPKLFTVADLLHCAPRGLRSPLLTRCIPRAPSTTLTTGVFVRHIFALTGDDYDDSSIITVLREVHRYSLEDHQGLLIDVNNGGTAFESSFLTATAALASSICFFQRVLVRAGERVALAMRCSITEGPLKITTYQGQYNDADDMRSPYPSLQFVGPVVYASNHPPIGSHKVATGECQSPKMLPSVRSRLSSIAFLEQSELEEAAASVRSEESSMIRFELRSVGIHSDGYPDTSRGSVCLREELYLRGEGDEVLPYFLRYLCEQFVGTVARQEQNALVVEIPLTVIQASMQMSTILHRSSYTGKYQGPY